MAESQVAGVGGDTQPGWGPAGPSNSLSVPRAWAGAQQLKHNWLCTPAFPVSLFPVGPPPSPPPAPALESVGSQTHSPPLPPSKAVLKKGPDAHLHMHSHARRGPQPLPLAVAHALSLDLHGAPGGDDWDWYLA